MMENPYIHNIFEPNIYTDDYPESENPEHIPANPNELAVDVAIAVHCAVMGGQFIVTKLKEDDGQFSLTNMETGKRYKVVVSEE